MTCQINWIGTARCLVLFVGSENSPDRLQKYITKLLVKQNKRQRVLGIKNDIYLKNENNF